MLLVVNGAILIDLKLRSSGGDRQGRCGLLIGDASKCGDQIWALSCECSVSAH